MRPGRSFFLVLIWATAFLFFSACQDSTPETSAQVFLRTGAVRLPPGTPGVISGSTLLLTPFPELPIIHYANCFAGVENEGEVGIGSAAGYNKDSLSTVTLPVNLNLGSAVLGAYRIQISVSHPEVVEIDPGGVFGSNPELSSADCRDRGCPSGCVSDPEHFPPQFQRAQGFEAAPTVTGNTTAISVAATDQDPAHPTTGRVNLFNVRFRVIGDLPPGGVALTLEVELLEDHAHQPLTHYPLPGSVIIAHYQID